jgi:Ricin-type beta-trefoil lectin domain-like/Ricin-type beta-trefoil lectin domain
MRGRALSQGWMSAGKIVRNVGKRRSVASGRGIPISGVRGIRRAVLALFIAGFMLIPAASASAVATPLAYFGGEVANNPHVYVTFWGKNWNGAEASAARSEIQKLFNYLPGSPWEGIMTQYYDSSGYISSNLSFDSWTDESVAAPGEVSEAHLENELEYAIAQRKWPGAGYDNVYIVLPAPGSKFEPGFVEGCGRHRYSGRISATYAYAYWPAGETEGCLEGFPAGPALSATVSHEYAEAVTDPVTVSYAGHKTGWIDGAENNYTEIADKCFRYGIMQLPNGSYAQELWDNYQDRCSLSDPSPPHLLFSKTTVESSVPLNGNPGWVSVRGKVESAQSLNGKTVNVELKKLEGGVYVTKSTLQTTVTNNSYEISNWEGVGPGEWAARAVFPEQAPFDRSYSNEETEGHFTVRDGYHIVNKNSGKCLDVYYGSKENGASVKQQYCADPTVYQNQVYTLVPAGNGYLKLKPRHSGSCLEIAGASQENTALLQQWTCNGSAQQSWQPVTLEEAGGIQYIRLIAKHSGKCLDVLTGSLADGAAVGQWECNATAQQKWSLQSVDSAPIPTEVTETAPESERLNGQPGYASVHGYVKTGSYGIPSPDNYVNVNYEKEVSANTYQLIKTVHPVLNSEGFYEVRSEGLATGNWRIWAGFQGSGNLAASQSGKVNVQIKSGYRFVFRQSGKCLSLSGNNPTAGTPIVQWTCSASPSPGDGQVFTLVPAEVGYFNVVVNSTGKCVDVTEWSQSPGTWLRQYSCGEKQTNQLWQVVPIQGQPGWNAFVVKHSGQCADVYASSTANGAQLVQWPCNWGGNEQWSFQAVN